MLFNPKWNKKSKVKTDPMKLESLIAWLETMPPEQAYNYLDVNNCLMCQYFSAKGYRNVFVVPSHFAYYKSRGIEEYPSIFDAIARDGAHYMGAALGRARKALDA